MSDEIERIRRDHIADPDGDPNDPHCVMCSDASYPIWPCDTALLQALLAERDAEIARLVLTTRSDREYAEMKQRAEEAERQVARLVSERDVYRDSLLLISRGVWTARNSVESIVWSVREALKKGAALAARGGAS